MLLSLKGMKVEKYTFNPFYLEIPVHIGYKYPITRSVAILGEFGPYFGIGFLAQLKVKMCSAKMATTASMWDWACAQDLNSTESGTLR